MAAVGKWMRQVFNDEKNHIVGSESSVRSGSEGKFDHSASPEFRRWASENKLAKHTQRMLALEHFDSMTTIKMLQPEMIDMFLLPGEDRIKLLQAVGKLHMNLNTNDSDYSYISDTSSSHSSTDAGYEQSRQRMSQSTPELRNIFTISGRESFKRGDNCMTDVDHSPKSSYIASEYDSQSIGTTESSAETVHSLREEELRDVLEYMVLEEIITREIQEHILSKQSHRNRVQLLWNILLAADDNTRTNLEDILRTNYNASLPTCPDNVDYGSWNRRKGGECGDKDGEIRRSSSKRVSWASKDTNVSNRRQKGEQRKVNDNDVPETLMVTINVEDNRPKGIVNPFYEDDDGRMELLQSPSLKFGKKGRQEGELQDATSVTCMKDGETIVTDLVNNRLQSFDRLGDPVRAIVLPRRFEPWNVVISPHGWIAATYRKSKALSIISSDLTELSAVGEDVFESPTGLAVDHCGRYIVTDDRANRVTIHDYDHKFHRFTTRDLNENVQFNQPRYVAVSPQGKIIVSDSGNHCIKVFKPNGDLEIQFGSYGHVRGYFRCPYGVCSDSSGNIFVADHYNNRVSMFNSQGHFVKNLVTRSQGLIRPKGIHISSDRKLHITHGGMKACELLVFDFVDDSDKVTYV